jgi:hypothetical protein
MVLFFIDGDHEAAGPLMDAQVCEAFAEPDAMVMFHDLASPDVAKGLEYFRDRGWQTIVYQTAQIMGAAWRGNVEPIVHRPDARVAWPPLPAHLSGFEMSSKLAAGAP